MIIEKHLKKKSENKLKIYDANKDKVFYMTAKQFLKRWGL